MAAPLPAPRGVGLLVAAAVMAAWGGHLAWLLLPTGPSPASPVGAAHLLFQAWLCTGLFITAHDAMHGTVTRVKWLNHAVGAAACFLFAGFSYRQLLVNHHKHHAAPATAEDPDFLATRPRFWPWFFSFLWRYATVLQVVVMGAAYNALKYAGVPEARIVAFFVMPSFLAALQLFFFGTWQPHRPPFTDEMGPHRARTLRRNHAWAFFSCFFFGYHREHHESPGTPWWLLWRARERSAG